MKKLTTTRFCWQEGCGTDESLTTDQLVNNQDFREAVELFNSNGKMVEEQARVILLKLWKMDPVRKPPIHLFRVGRAEESPTWTPSPRTTS